MSECNVNATADLKEVGIKRFNEIINATMYATIMQLKEKKMQQNV